VNIGRVSGVPTGVGTAVALPTGVGVLVTTAVFVAVAVAVGVGVLVGAGVEVGPVGVDGGDGGGPDGVTCTCAVGTLSLIHI